MKESSPQLYSLSQTHLHLSHSPFTGPPVMSHGCVKIVVEEKSGVGWEREGSGRAGSEKSSNDETRGKWDKQGTEIKSGKVKAA